MTVTPTDPSPAPARRSLARPLRWLRNTVAILALLAVVTWLAVPYAVRRLGESQGSEALGRALHIGAAHFNPLTLELRLDDLSLAGPTPADPPAATLAHLVVNLEWRSLWHRAPVLNAVALDTPRLRIARTGPGTFDFDDILARLARDPSPPAKDDAGPARFALYNIRIEHGSVAFEDRVVHDRHQVDDIALGVPFLSDLPGDVAIEVEPRLRFVLDGAPFDSAAQATPFQTTRNGDVQLHTGEIALARWLPYWPAALGWRPAQGRLKLDAKLAFEAPPKATPRLSIAGDLVLEDLALVDAQSQPLVAWKTLAVHADALRPLERQVALQRVALDGLDVPLARDAQGVLNLVRAFAGHAAASAPASGAASAPASAAASPPASVPAWGARIAAIDLTNARVGWRDAAVEPAVDYALADLQVHVADLRWPLPPGPAASATAAASAAAPASAPRPGDAVRVHAEGRWTTASAATAPASPRAKGGKAAAPATPADAHLVVDGALGAARSGLEASVDGFALAPLRPYLAPYVVPTLDGTLGVTARLRWDGAPGDGPPAIEVPRLAVDAFALREPGRAAPAAAWQRMALEGLVVDLAQHRVALAGASLAQPEAWIERDARGVVNAARWTPPAAASAPATAASSAGGPAWQAQVGKLSVTGGRLHWRDAPAAGPVALDVDALQLALTDVAWPAAARAKTGVRLGARFTPGNRTGNATAGKLDFDGQVGLAPVSWDGRLHAERLPLHVFDAYLADASPLQLLHADAGWRGLVQGELTLAGPRMHAKGDALLTDLHARARYVPDPANANPDDLLAWQSLGARGTELTLTPGKPIVAAVQEVTLDQAYARLVVTEQGRFNLTDLAPPPAAAASGAAAAAPASSAAVAVVAAASGPAGADTTPDIRIGRIAWTNARIEYTDRFVRPNYSADLSDVHGSLGAFSMRTPDLAPLQLEGRVAGTGLLDVQGQLNPLARPLALDVRAKATDIELAPLSPYAGKYAGYAIERGKLSMDLHYKIAPDGRLEASNQVTLNQLTFGEKVDSPSATKLPVLFAVALLKDRNGVIDVNLPVGGSINEPDFSVGRIVVKLIVNLLTKALTAPFALLSGGGQDDLSQVLFVPGTARPSEGADKALDKVAKALQDRPSLSLTITGLADEEQERADLQAANLDARLAALRRSELQQAGDANPPASQPLTSDDRARLVKRLYQDTKLPDKPRNVLGIAKDLPQPEMEARLKTGLPIAPDAARQLAVQRAIVVRDALAGRGLPNERMFVASPKIHGAGSAEPEAWLPHAQLELSAK